MAPNPKDSMRSTWPTSDRSDWNHHHWLLHLLDVYPQRPGEKAPVHAKTDKIPYTPQLRVQAWILLHALQPVALHQGWIWYMGTPLNNWATFFLYFFSFGLIAVQEIYLIRKLGSRHGYLDGDVAPRDGIPDVGISKVGEAFYKTVGWRMAMQVLVTYNKDVEPLDVLLSWKWWCLAFIKIGFYGLAVDFFFYWYHRAMHEVDFLWKFHRKHHLTKHPNPLLGAYADEEQEFFDMAVIPFLAYWTLRAAGLPLGFYDWWFAFQYVAFSELMGHGGVRMTGPAPSPFAKIYEALGMELVTEDHDLHHRYGYRSSQSYGKQTKGKFKIIIF